MPGQYLQSIGSIPSCIPGPGSSSLKDWIQSLNAKASERFNRSDDHFSREDFQYARTQPWGRDLNRFAGFEDFRRRIYQTIEKNINSERCACDGRWMEGKGESPGECVPDPKAPRRPSPPPAPRRGPRPGPKKSGPEKPKGLDPSQLDIHQNSGWSVVPPEGIEAQPIARSRLPGSPGERYSREAPSPFEAGIEDGPVRVPTNTPYVAAYYDGKDFILDIYGCEIRLPSWRCIRDWSYYFLLLRNFTKGNFSKKRAGYDGWARIKVAAQPGDLLILEGQDSQDGHLSINVLKYIISETGRPEFLDEMMRNGGPISRALPNYLAPSVSWDEGPVGGGTKPKKKVKGP